MLDNTIETIDGLPKQSLNRFSDWICKAKKRVMNQCTATTVYLLLVESITGNGYHSQYLTNSWIYNNTRKLFE